MTQQTNKPRPPWPPLMRAATTAAYVDEVSVDAFRRRIGLLYPRPLKISGRGELWLRDDLDRAIERLADRESLVKDASAVL